MLPRVVKCHNIVLFRYKRKHQSYLQDLDMMSIDNDLMMTLAQRASGVQPRSSRGPSHWQRLIPAIGHDRGIMTGSDQIQHTTSVGELPLRSKAQDAETLYCDHWYRNRNISVSSCRLANCMNMHHAFNISKHIRIWTHSVAEFAIGAATGG